MALYQVGAGNPEVILDVNQYFNLLTGVMTDQPVTIAHDTTIKGGSLLVESASATNAMQIRSDNSTSDPGLPWIRSDGNALAINPHGTGQLYLAWDVPNQTNVGGALAVTGAVSGTAGTFTGAVQSHSHPVLEGVAGATHVEILAPAGSDSVGSGNGVSKTLTFARAFTSVPAVAAICQSTAANHWTCPTGIVNVSTTSVTVEFGNTDGSTQTLSQYCIIAIGT